MDTPSKVEKGAGKRKGGGKKNKPISQSQKAGLLFPVGRIRCYLKRGRYAERISASAPIYMAAVLEYLVAEVLDFAGNVARANKRSSITPKHISRAMWTDEDLGKLLDGVTISQGGVIPNI